MKIDLKRIEVVDDVVAEILKRKTPQERIKIGFDLWTSARNMLTAHLKSIHPDWSKEVLAREVARRLSHGTH